MALETLGIIGGSGLTRLQALEVERREIVQTPWGEPSAPLVFGRFDGLSVVFIPRHGTAHNLPPHKVNYRANLWALKEAGVAKIIGMAAVGGITQAPGNVCIPDQIIDYTWGRKHTYFENDLEQVTHIDFTEPYCEELRQSLIQSARALDIEIIDKSTYGATQGPRLESSMEIQRMERDGCDIVGMTGMPETALAKELGICYASCAVVVNWAAGKTEGPITMEEIESNLLTVMKKARKIVGGMAI